MTTRAVELDLPLDEASAFDAGVAGSERHEHLLAIPGVDELTVARLARVFPSLGAVYGAPEERLAAVAGPVAAARIRWFLDAPLTSQALPGRRRRQRSWRTAA